MTYFLMFQLGFMVIGWLYALWRIVLALVVMLLYSVAALDRSLMHTAQVSASKAASVAGYCKVVLALMS